MQNLIVKTFINTSSCDICCWKQTWVGQVGPEAQKGESSQMGHSMSNHPTLFKLAQN